MISQKKLSQKIKKLRNEFSFSQEEFAQKIGLSRVAVSQLEIGRRGLSTLELVKISEVFGVSVDFLLLDNENKENSYSARTESKKFTINKDKLKNTILYILEKCGGKPNVGETVLYKLLYFIDFDSYELYGKPVTGINYVKLQFGPVPRAKEYNPIIKLMINSGKLKIITQNYHGMIQKRYIALKESDKSLLSEQEKNIINEIILKYSDMSAKSIENFVHGDAPWKQCANQKIINYNFVFDRIPPYSHRNYNDEFMQISASDIIKNLGTISKEEVNYYESL
ncbi:DUF4065 domain-containing protein [Candidatus Parcubacteria bacterium]|nr:DUF4065 domain-containing protein [Candidatus Parcubacteria bacterium]